MAFDREGHGAAFFSALVTEGIPFVTWEKHTDAAKRAALEADRFADEFELNGKRYGVFEEAKAYRHALADAPAHCSQLRRITLWNKSSNRSACGLAWDGGKGMSTVECPSAILPPYVRLAPSPLPGGSYVEYPVIKHLAECFHSSR